MSSSGAWQLAPAYDATFFEGPSGYHQMDVMGEALEIDRGVMLRLADEAGSQWRLLGASLTEIAASIASFRPSPRTYAYA